MMNIGKDDRRIAEYKDRSRKRGWKDRKMELEKHDRKKEDVKLLNVCRFHHHHPHEGTFSFEMLVLIFWILHPRI